MGRFSPEEEGGRKIEGEEFTTEWFKEKAQRRLEQELEIGVIKRLEQFHGAGWSGGPSELDEIREVMKILVGLESQGADPVAEKVFDGIVKRINIKILDLKREQGKITDTEKYHLNADNILKWDSQKYLLQETYSQWRKALKGKKSEGKK